jgi:sulfur transfer protein SufE
MKDRIKHLEDNVEKLEQSGHKVTLEMGKELERLKTQLNEKDKKISELDSQLYLNSAEIKKL